MRYITVRLLIGNNTGVDIAAVIGDIRVGVVGDSGRERGVFDRE